MFNNSLINKHSCYLHINLIIINVTGIPTIGTNKYFNDEVFLIFIHLFNINILNLR